jgi:hypothetical protein
LVAASQADTSKSKLSSKRHGQKASAAHHIAEADFPGLVQLDQLLNMSQERTRGENKIEFNPRKDLFVKKPKYEPFNQIKRLESMHQAHTVGRQRRSAGGKTCSKRRESRDSSEPAQDRLEQR